MVQAAGRWRSRCSHYRRANTRSRPRVFSLGGHAVSPDGRLLAYAVDSNGSERFVVKVRDLGNGHGASRSDRELALRSGLGGELKELPLYRRRRTLAVEDRLAPSARRSAIGGSCRLPRAGREIRGVDQPLAIAGVRAHLHWRSRDERGPSAADETTSKPRLRWYRTRKRTGGTTSTSARVRSTSASTTPIPISGW